ncbi:diguanylate cyclase [Halarchaeum grantii]|uniref:Diguanylate cyclase n=1 Tax=Halarchaeum grantii TaxID=1193105 RepID=A0A830F6J9_9EURY|nr:VOC family protein [Halarchaeum grantii]GGL43957.1 diguanylate cyclase [Halarchaeum grantii]
MLSDTPGIHHVTGLAGDAQANLDFYTEVLGLRLVRRTVNLEDVLQYHLLFGNADGSPGTVYTSFPAREAEDGRVGPPQPASMAFAVPEDSLGYWRERLADCGVASEEETRFGPDARYADDASPAPRAETALRFSDPDGTRIELVEADQPVEPWTSRVPEAHAIRGFFGVAVLSVEPYATASVLDTLGFDLVAQDGDRIRYRAPGDVGATIDVLDRDVPFGREGAGVLHHVAVRVADEAELHEWRDLFAERDLRVSRVKDRHVFHSLYVREPGGILFELATDGPGVTVDQPRERLGEELVLPGRYEEDRDLVESQLPALDYTP